jgi:hypothetical protein
MADRLPEPGTEPPSRVVRDARCLFWIVLGLVTLGMAMVGGVLIKGSIRP